MKKIGITLDWQKSGTFSRRPHYALREAYFNMIYAAGGLPVAIPYIYGAIDKYLSEVDAVVIPGGDFAFKNEWYVDPAAEKPFEESNRLDFDIELIKKVLDIDMPILGICAGMQMMACLNGAKMTHNIKQYSGTEINHSCGQTAEEYAHNVNVKAGTLLHKIVNVDSFPVNTAHTEAIVQVSDNVIVSGTADDGVIEAIEIADKKFALGVEWHPEFFIQAKEPSFRIIKALIRSA